MVSDGDAAPLIDGATVSCSLSLAELRLNIESILRMKFMFKIVNKLIGVIVRPISEHELS